MNLSSKRKIYFPANKNRSCLVTATSDKRKITCKKKNVPNLILCLIFGRCCCFFFRLVLVASLAIQTKIEYSAPEQKQRKTLKKKQKQFLFPWLSWVFFSRSHSSFLVRSCWCLLFSLIQSIKCKFWVWHRLKWNDFSRMRNDNKSGCGWSTSISKGERALFLAVAKWEWMIWFNKWKFILFFHLLFTENDKKKRNLLFKSY